MELIFIDSHEEWQRFLPFTFTRPISEIRIGIFTLTEKWLKYLDANSFSFITEPYLQVKFQKPARTSNQLLINAAVCPDPVLILQIQDLKPGQAIFREKSFIAGIAGHEIPVQKLREPDRDDFEVIEYQQEYLQLKYAWDIFIHNGQQIRLDFENLLDHAANKPVADPNTIVYNPDQVFLEDGVKIKAAVLNAENGPIYLGKHSSVSEGANIRGPFSLGDHSIVSMGAKIRGDSSTGPWCRLGGEVGNSILFGYSNKAHDGYLGNSVIGCWCNLGADTNTSNLKNNYAFIKMWNFEKESFQNSGLQFCGLLMGDHSKSGINTMFNTGTVVGVSANIFGSGFPRSFIPSFSWGGASGMTTFEYQKAVEVAQRVMERRGLHLDAAEEEILQVIHQQTSKYRIWEK
jgi:UDP-N-acetylglucosamine diphosphorylase/glucosamine-1-phosphate N-acetyltransferase